MIKKFDEVFVDKTRLGKKIPKEEYKKKGKYIIIDQGKDKIAGFTDNEDGIFTDVPTIIFGDHTRIIKYIDKPFFLGADGVKVLKSKTNNANYKYLYYALKAAYIPNTGYNRHFKWLKKVSINYPSFEKQKRIVKLLDNLSEVKNKKNEELKLCDTLIKARFVEMFGDLKFDTPVSKYIESLTAGKSLAGKEKCTNKVLNTGAVSYDKFKNDYKYLPSNYVPDENNKVRTGNVLISRMNTQELVGATAYVWEAPENTYLPDRLWRANLKENVNSIFLWQVLIHPLLKLQIQRVSSGTSGSMKNISKSNFLKLKVPDVNEESQNKFASFVQQVDKSKVAIQKSLDETQILYDSLMQKYFS
ncbi:MULTISPECIES: restriction endonuclease subunit S [unclassified Lactobacillus]|uniref:restriction endonuclease subunit S n=1 Tax=unclassified Lactobacillus TaxID=2620435 RepID=UPI000BEEAB56|nr:MULTISPECIES: restriction endonuclease subunit S [unclassified Lactobacillus]PEG87150.1 restriction endonuclease [Lactobacillus sp. UMNPBX14]PEH02679.1 restriction endonuclease [Lactobacillus sp. UMNPBX6]